MAKKKKDEVKEKEDLPPPKEPELPPPPPPPTGPVTTPGDDVIILEVDDDDFNEEDTAEEFKDSQVRKKFIRKVYLLLSMQLCFTMLCNLPFMMVDDIQEFVYDHPKLVYVCLAFMLIPYFILVCCEGTRRHFPRNLILLAMMTLGMAGVCGYMTAKLNTELVFYALILTVIVTIIVTITAIFSPIDFTKYRMLLCVILIVLSGFGAVALFVITLTDSKIINVVYAGICVIVFTLFLLMDTQAIMGGKRISLNPEDYILGAIQLYVDIVEIFLNLLEIIGTCGEGN